MPGQYHYHVFDIVLYSCSKVGVKNGFYNFPYGMTGGLSREEKLKPRAKLLGLYVMYPT